jgi:hypothetical protein
MQSAGAVLQQMAPELVISKQKLRQAEGSCLVRTKREEKNQILAFSSRPFALCGLPVRRPPERELLFERRNGNFVLQITGHPDFGFALRSGPAGANLSGDAGGATQEPNGLLQEWR